MDNPVEKGLRRRLGDIPVVKRLVGTYVSTDGIRAQVDVAGNRIPADFAGYLPEVNEDVWVLFIDSTATILGPTVLKPGQGTIAASPVANLVAVDTAAGPLTIPYASGLTLSAGQKVKLGAANDGLFVYAVMSTSPTAATPPPAPGGSGTPSQQTFMPIDSGSFQSRWWTGDVYASDSNTGAWFYGSTIADTIPDGATILSIEVYISIKSFTAQAPKFGVHPSGTKPGGNVALSMLTAVNISNGFISLPTSFGDYLKGGASGVGIYQGGYSILRSVVDDPQSGALRIRWA